ncbi:protein phtf [Sitodiplosis mosellana]|uniref:protein phtf n=1 Tax=Sitodiplosis mosellana TaxID=263140 RepID=UPI002443E98C|nr:protein phtf [Sitodiplosis mosellana]XP_055320502.1 protein phtf [Sitodiplosis mosellana]XP_055320503.1 protein phtf [Sitodiplosis mosellana]XP_055320505.1 protein phtf [Sitodiplosis mosellana]XP_055320506.1 protein phtf [Sitodiplosis mosellana]XP_055320507.1 protein phtf [Sitodiplosis mosellana]XP_055320508.1 protein phtf [Sitodiplosis mosellana]XP_055320509.1 protein phtf [Sitodiplosis mosellana]XP_055320510.1 protein phtf [Sitodiplosis mosellana]XP_055320511.1 protein phtf [Sitodiplo
MKLGEIVAWYQKKIGTYDKQPWEQLATVEHRILSGFVNTPSKNVAARTEYIDVDLVRGSTFPKAKPKQGLLTVLRLAVVRYLLLPLYAKWWVAQTSSRIFAFLFFLYAMQMLNWAIYSYNVNKPQSKSNESDTCSANGSQDEKSTIDFISITDLVVPMSLSLLLSLIHSQIVATSTTNLSASDKLNKGPIQPNRKKRERKKRRKSTRSRSSLNTLVCNETKSRTNSLIEEKEAIEANVQIGRRLSSPQQQQEQSQQQQQQQPQQKENEVSDSNCSPPRLRKRNVNWRSPIKSNSIAPDARNSHDMEEEVMVRIQDNDNRNENENETIAADDDGFESLNGKSSSGEEMSALNNGQAIDAQNETTHRSSNQKYANSAYLMGSFDENDANNNSDNDRINGTNKIAENNCDKINMRHLLTLKCSRGTPVFSNRDNLKRYTSDEEDEEDEVDGGSQQSSPTLAHKPIGEGTSSAAEWIGITTNSEECSYSSADNSESQLEYSENNGCEWNDYVTPTVILNSNCAIGDRINCTIWDGRELKKIEMSVLEISSAIIKRVEAIPETCDYVYIGLVFSLVLSLVPAFCRLCEAVINSSESNEINFLDMPALLLEKTSFSYEQTLRLAFGETTWQKTVLFIDFLLRFSLTFLFFFLLAVAERTFKQRFLYAKLFSHLTSSRRARKSELPHFRLNKVRNIKTWLSVRSYLKRRGPQRSVEVIVSGSFILTLLLLAFLSVEWLKDSVQLQSQHTLEALIWSCALGCFLLRFMTLGTKINRKYRSISVLITEQINLYLQIEQKPHNKDELMVSNSVLKLAADLLKELESPFKISGLSANPYLYTTIKVVILSALSGVLSEMLGFKLKLHKIKIK